MSQSSISHVTLLTLPNKRTYVLTSIMRLVMKRQADWHQGRQEQEYLESEMIPSALTDVDF